jgi:hypothetical protein
LKFADAQDEMRCEQKVGFGRDHEEGFYYLHARIAAGRFISDRASVNP